MFFGQELCPTDPPHPANTCKRNCVKQIIQIPPGKHVQKELCHTDPLPANMIHCLQIMFIRNICSSKELLQIMI